MEITQEKCRLFKIPLPVLTDLVLACLEKPCEILELLLVCKKMFNILYANPRTWLSLVITNFSNVIGPPDEIEKCRNNIRNGFKDYSRDWKEILIEEYAWHKELTRKTNIKKLENYFYTSAYKKVSVFFSKIKYQFSIKTSIAKELEALKIVKKLEGSIILTINHTIPVENPSIVEINVLGSKILYNSSINSVFLQGRICLYSTEFSLIVMVNSEIHTEYFLFSLYEIAARLIKYKIPKIYENISRELRLLGYMFYLELHNLKENLFSCQSLLDFELENNAEVVWINGINYQIVKEKLSVDWNNSEMSEIINGIGIVDFLILSEFADPISWGSVASVLQLEEKNENHEDIYCLDVRKTNTRVSIFIKNKEKYWVIFSIKVSITKFYNSHNYI